MKKIIGLIILSMLSIVMYGQTSCYNETRNRGISYYNKGQYENAIKAFTAAKSCPDKPDNNDLDQRIAQCRKKQQEEERRNRENEIERQREAENRRQREQEERDRENKNASKGYIDINRVVFANVNNEGDIINDYGSTLYASDIKYLKPKFYISSLTSSSKSITFYCKMYTPNGTLMTGNSSPSGYTYSSSFTIHPNTTWISMSGWGNKNGGTYIPGTYKYELWYNGNRLYTTNVTLYKRENEATKLTVDNKTSVSTSFSENGGTETFYVSTDANEWTTWGVPSWCSVQNKSSTSFTLRCEANTSRSERSDYMKIKAGNKEVRIDITQSGKKGPSAVINNLWVEHNVFNGMIKGMRIHINLTVNGMLGKTVKYCVFFYLNDNTTRLINMYGGHISSSATGRATYESSTWSDWWIFVPYQWLYAAANRSNYCSFDVEIQDLNGNLLVRNANTQFVLY